MRAIDLCRMCNEYSIYSKCEHREDCKLLGILKENETLKRKLKETKKKLDELESEVSWEKYPDRMGK